MFTAINQRSQFSDRLQVDIWFCRWIGTVGYYFRTAIDERSHSEIILHREIETRLQGRYSIYIQA